MKFKFHYNRIRIAGTLHEDHYIYFIMSHSVILKIRNVSKKLYRLSKHIFLCLVTIFENRAFYEIMWKNIVERSRPKVMT